MNFSDMSGIKQWAALLVVGAMITGAAYFFVYKGQQEQNTKAQQALDAKLQENRELEAYRPKLAEIERQLASLKQQLEIERRIVPDEKEIDNFIKMLNAEALKAGIEVRSYTAKPTTSRDFFTEVPFDLELDGPYYSLLSFFNQVGKLERIINISGLQLATTKKPGDAKVKHHYEYAPTESVVASCTATTFFSHDSNPAAGAAKAAKGKGTL